MEYLNRDSSFYRKINYYLDLIIVLTTKEIKVKYKKSFLGYIWSVLNPLLLASVFYFAFKLIMKVPIENYTLFLLTALFPWQWFANSVGSAPSILLSNASLIKKVNFPRFFLPLANVLNDMLHFIFSIPVIVFFGLIYNVYPSLEWIIGLPLMLLTQLILVYGIVLIISSFNLFFRDLERLVLIGITILFYFTPIFYDISLIPEEYRVYLYLNPMFGIIHNWRTLFIKGEVDYFLYLCYLAYSFIILLIGYITFKKLSWRFAEVL